MTTPAGVLTAATTSGVLTGVTAALATLTAADMAGVAAVLGLLNEDGTSFLIEDGTFILDESGG